MEEIINKNPVGRPKKYTDEERKHNDLMHSRIWKHKMYHCDVCNKDIVRSSKYYHNEKSKKHIEFLKIIEKSN